jgi:hypothetical protein
MAEPAEDWAFWLDLARRNVQMRFVSEIVAIYVFHGVNSLMDYPEEAQSAVYMLRTFFDRPDLPAEIQDLERMALARVHLARGIRYLDQGKFRPSRTEFEAALRLHPEWLSDSWAELVDMCTGITGSRLGLRQDAGVLTRWVATALSRAHGLEGRAARDMARRLERSIAELRFWQAYSLLDRATALDALETLVTRDKRNLLRPRLWRAFGSVVLNARFRNPEKDAETDRVRGNIVKWLESCESAALVEGIE